MYVIGTAGHVDHGKSTLVEALTGIDPDRLREEKEREMTIDLGFAWLKLPLEEGNELVEVGVVDVPGHRDFIENMLAGIGGVDLALLVVAADEGVMPQTREHLAILDLLEAPAGVIAITKSDLVDDPDWLELVMLDISEAAAETALADTPLVAVSAKTGQGIDELRQTLGRQLATVSPQPDLGRPRLPVDRVFSLPGFGTVVTGTLLNGHFRVGDPVEIQPAGLKGRIRGLQTHKTKLETARPGSRVAINITGIDKTELQRGDVVAAPSVIQGTLLLDAAYRHLSDTGAPLKHNEQVKLFVGAAEVMARARLIGARQLKPGQEGWLQLALEKPAAVAKGDRFILRRPSPGATLGGGRILDPHPGRRHRRFRPEVVERLATLAQGTPAELLLQSLQRLEPVEQKELFRQSGLDETILNQAWSELTAEKQIVQLNQHLLSYAGWQKLAGRIEKTLTGYHQNFPLRSGMPREELRSRLKLSPALFNAVVSRAAADAILEEEGALLRRPGHTIQFTPAQEEAAARLRRQFEQAGVNSPSVKEAKAIAGEDIYYALLDLNELQQISGDVVYRTSDYERFTSQIRQYLQEHGTINAAQLRDLLQTSRKYAIALLEHLDDRRITRRVGDDRELINN